MNVVGYRLGRTEVNKNNKYYLSYISYLFFNVTSIK